MIERRKYVRLQAPLGIRYRTASGRGDEHRALVRNLSGGGLSLAVRCDLREGDLLRVSLEIPHLESPVDALAEVVWLEPAMREPSREVGLKFRDIEAESLRHILEYVHTVGIG
ncbi:MAG: hypothetical protein MOGMAGMI_00913 [Candidatus Omnitrophica bacterium]|nr:hypothetical protein [Candidatus Omnitrophota bacterium]